MAGLPSEPEALVLLRLVAVLALEGKPRHPFAPAAPNQARTPLHAAAMMGGDFHLGLKAGMQLWQRFRRDLEATGGKATEVNWLRLAVYVTVETALVYTGIMYLPMLFLLTKESEQVPSGTEGCAQFVAILLLLQGLIYSLFVCPPLVLLIAVLMRGGVGLYLMDLTLVTRNGQPARRWRCAFRALLTWIQLMLVAGLLAVGTFLMVGIPYPIYQSWAAIILYFHLLAYAMIGELLLAWLPRRSLADRLCGTYLLPK